MDISDPGWVASMKSIPEAINSVFSSIKILVLKS